MKLLCILYASYHDLESLKNIFIAEHLLIQGVEEQNAVNFSTNKLLSYNIDSKHTPNIISFFLSTFNFNFSFCKTYFSKLDSLKVQHPFLEDDVHACVLCL